MVKPPTASSIDALIDEALVAQKNGDLDHAVGVYDRVLSLDPEHAEALHFLGLCHHQKGDHKTSISLLSRASKNRPEVAMFRFNLGLVQSAASDHTGAVRTFATMFESGARTPELLNAYAVALKNSGDWEASEGVFRTLLAQHPKSLDGLYNLGSLYLSLGRVAEAQELLHAAKALSPGNPDVLKNCAVALQRSGETAKAQEILEDLLKVSPMDAGALTNLGIIHRQNGRLADAADLLARAADHDPMSAETHYNLGAVYATQNRIAEAQQAFSIATQSDATHTAAKWASVLSLPQIYQSEDQIAEARAGITKGLEELTDAPLPDRIADIAQLFASAEERTLFALAYQGCDDRPLMAMWGAFIHRIAQCALPALTEPVVGSGGDRCRIGFVSAHWRAHTIEKLFSQWMTNLSPEDFEVHLISTSGPGDPTTTTLAAQVEHAHTATRGTTDLAKFIRGLSLDVIVYTDIGMDPWSQVLAALRLAPRQLVAFGHPVTTGLPSVDTFLTSDLMETADGDKHYTEPLIRLPNLGVSYSRPTKPDGPLPAHDFLCAQSLFKILPRQDDVFAEILCASSGATLTFFAHSIPEVSAAFQARLSAALQRRGLDPDTRLSFIPPCGRQDFLRHLAGAKMVLDTFAWSGGNTSLETLAMETPVVTMPGRLMRSRHTAAMLQRMDADEWIAETPEKYVETAIGCLLDKNLSAAYLSKLRANSDRLYNDPSPTTALASLCLTRRN